MEDVGEVSSLFSLVDGRRKRKEGKGLDYLPVDVVLGGGEDTGLSLTGRLLGRRPRPGQRLDLEWWYVGK